jgi:hypothetical protein
VAASTGGTDTSSIATAEDMMARMSEEHAARTTVTQA